MTTQTGRPRWSRGRPAPRTYDTSLELTMTTDPIGETTTETARALLWRHGLPEDIIDGALCLHAQELAARQRAEMRAPGRSYDASRWNRCVGMTADVIDPTKSDEEQRTAAPAAGLVAVPPTTQTALRDRIAWELRSLVALGGTPPRKVVPVIDASNPRVPRIAGWKPLDELVDAVLAVLPPPADRAAVLREAADIAESLRQFERCTGPRGAAQVSENVGILRVADELRRLAAEAEPPLSPDYQHPECGFHWHGKDGMDIPMRDGQPVCPRCEIKRLHEEHKASLRRADEINNSLMEEVQRYAAGTERPVLWSVYNEMHLRADNAEAAVDRVRRLHDNLVTDTGLSGPDDLITKDSAARRIATALDGWNPSGLPGCDVEFEGGGRCAKPAGHRPPGSDDPHVPEPAAETQPDTQAASTPCPDPIECEHEAALGQAKERITQVRMVIATHRAHLELTDPILLSKLDRAVTSDQPAAVSAVGQTDTEATPCGPTPDVCDAEAGEPCANHEREQAHAEGEHCFCGPECTP